MRGMIIESSMSMLYSDSTMIYLLMGGEGEW